MKRTIKRADIARAQEHVEFGVYRPPSAGEEEPFFQTFFDSFQDLDRFSVIGNIYEHPELLGS